MSAFLYRLGRFAYRRRIAVTALWLALLVATGIGGAALAGDPEESFDIPGTESMEAFTLLQERFPEMAPSGATARVVFAAPEGLSLLEPDLQAAIAQTVGALNGMPQTVLATDPFQAQAVSADGRVAYSEVRYDVQLPDNAEAHLTEAVTAARDAGLTVELSGVLVPEIEQSTGELIGLIVAAIVLVLTFGSLIAAGMPLLNAFIGIGVTISAITIGTGVIGLSSFTPTLALMLGLALAIDYSLFILSRYRHELRIGREGEEAMGRAIGTAGSAVVFAGLTVVIALTGLTVVNIPVLTEIGLAAAFSVVMSVLIALTMLPALCGFAGRKIFGARIPGLRDRDPESDEGKPGLGARWARLVTRRPVPVLVLAAVGMLALAAPAVDLRLGLPDDGSMSPETTQRRAYDLLAEGFGPGFNGPLMVMVDTSEVPDPEAAADQVHQVVGQLAMAMPAVFNQAGDTAVITVIPATGPSAEETAELVETIREQTATVEGATGAEVSVTGATAVLVDFNQKMADSLLPYLGLVVGLSFVLLMLVFRSVLVPLKAALGFLLTMAATFGVTVAVFQWGWGAGLLGIEENGIILSLLPVFLIGMVFGLAMDYQVFLVTRMREEYVHGADPVPAVVTGFRHGSRVVTAAAVIMISVFAGFAFSGEDFIMQVAVALAAAIALDAFVVRMTIVPALLSVLGRAAWWLPRWLDRLLPNVDVEGEKLRRAAEPQREPATVGS